MIGKKNNFILSHNAKLSNHNKTDKSSCVIQGDCLHQPQRELRQSQMCLQAQKPSTWSLMEYSCFRLTPTNVLCLQNPSSRCKCVASDWWLLCLHWITEAYQMPLLWIFMLATWAELTLEITCVQSGLKKCKGTQAHIWFDTWKQRLHYNVNPNTWNIIFSYLSGLCGWGPSAVLWCEWWTAIPAGAGSIG